MSSGRAGDWVAKAKYISLDVRDLIDGRSLAGLGAVREKLSPRDGQPLYSFSDTTPHELDEAVRAARTTVEDGRWSGLSVQQRKDVLFRLARLLEERHEEFALLECLDVGKPIRDALSVDVPAAVASIRASAEAIDYVAGKVYVAHASALAYQLQRPVGVVGAIVGWNFPLVLAAGKIGPALATGNSVVLKPSELTSLSAARLAQLALEAGVPPGVFNVVHGERVVGEAIAVHPDIDLISFTGSSQTGREILNASGRSNMKRLILECGGKAPNIVFEDSPDLDGVAAAIIERAFWNQGQVCTASSRLLVQESIRQPLIDRILTQAKSLTLGDPLDETTRQGALVGRAHCDKVNGYIRRGDREGAVRVYASTARPPFADGCYVPPVIFDQVTPSMAIAQEEIFGPVLSVLSFRDTEEAIRIANGTIYGLSAIAWTKDLPRAQRLSYALQAGSVTIFATSKAAAGAGEGVIAVGGLKQSGMSVEGGIEGLQAYLAQTAVQIYV